MRVDRAAIELALRAVIGDPVHAGSQTPAVVTLLVREYVRSGGADLRRATEAAITRGLERVGTERDPCARMQWLRAVAESAAWSEDRQLGEWADRALPGAIDALESLVRRDYEPGEGLPGRSLLDHLQCAASLLAGFELSGRLPYAMLAEELLQSSRRTWWDASRSQYDGDFVANCRAARVSCGLAALRADADYVRRAVVAPEQAYRQDAALILTELVLPAGLTPADAAEHAVALLEWFALDGNLH